MQNEKNEKNLSLSDTILIYAFVLAIEAAIPAYIAYLNNPIYQTAPAGKLGAAGVGIASVYGGRIGNKIGKTWFNERSSGFGLISYFTTIALGLMAGYTLSNNNIQNKIEHDPKINTGSPSTLTTLKPRKSKKSDFAVNKQQLGQISSQIICRTNNGKDLAVLSL